MYRNRLTSLFLTILLLVFESKSFAQTPWANSGLPLPRFVSLRSDVVNMRTGPGVRYPIVWVYNRRFMPLEVVNEYTTWRKVRDFQGSEGWMHQGMLSNKRYLLVTGQNRTLRSEPQSTSPPVAQLEQGSIGEIKKCADTSGWCEILIGGFRGWIRKVETWGAFKNEKIN